MVNNGSDLQAEGGLAILLRADFSSSPARPGIKVLLTRTRLANVLRACIGGATVRVALGRLWPLRNGLELFRLTPATAPDCPCMDDRANALCLGNAEQGPWPEAQIRFNLRTLALSQCRYVHLPVMPVILWCESPGLGTGSCSRAYSLSCVVHLILLDSSGRV